MDGGRPASAQLACDMMLNGSNPCPNLSSLSFIPARDLWIDPLPEPMLQDINSSRISLQPQKDISLSLNDVTAKAPAYYACQQVIQGVCTLN